MRAGQTTIVETLSYLRGNIESFDNNTLTGWAFDGSPNPVRLKILVDEEPYDTILANLPRPDIATTGIDNINCGFVIEFSDAVLSRRTFRIQLESASDGRLLWGTPCTIELLQAASDKVAPPAPQEAPRLEGQLEEFKNGKVRGWARTKGAQPVTLQIICNGDPLLEVVADQPRPDMKSEEQSETNVGFSFSVPDSQRLGRRCIIEAFVIDNGEYLSGSPLVVEALPLPTTETQIELAELSPLISRLTDGVHSSKKLITYVPVLLSWLQHTIDRASALQSFEKISFETFNAAVDASGGLKGSIGHLYGLMQQNFPPLTIPRTEKPVVSIVIPVHNKFSLTYDCINSIVSAHDRTGFEIILVDDCSSDETLLAHLVFQGGVHIARPPKNEGFVGACNLGWQQAQGDYVLFLNNDTIVSDGWLDALVETFDIDERIGIAGSRLLFADGTLQECGGIIWRDGSGWNWGRGQDKSHPAFSYMRDADYVSGAALMIRRSLLRELGGFDTHYAPAYYEDTDLCFRARAAGYRVVVQPGSTIVHLEGQSNGTDLGSGLKRYQVVNAKKFRSRWRDVLATHRPNGSEPYLESERPVTRRAVFIDDTTPTPDQDAGSNAALEHMLSLQRLGYKVTFLPADNMAHIPQYTERLQFRGIECWYAPHAWSVEEFFRRNRAKIDVVYIHRKSNMENYERIVRKFCKDAKVVFNYADVHALREMREAEVRGLRTELQTKLEQKLEDELDLALQAESVIVHSHFERDFIRSRRAGSNVHYVPWTVRAVDSQRRFEDRRDIAFVGGYRHTPNVDAVQWFVKKVWPAVTKIEQRHIFKIVGSHMPAALQSLTSPTISPVGFVEDLDTMLDDLRLTVAPLRYGAGLKGKVITSFARGVPCVMTSIAAEGMDLPPELTALIADDEREMARKIAEILNNAPLWEAASQAALRFVQESFSPARIDELLAGALSGVTAAPIEQPQARQQRRARR
jgi:GT2 family glycosyltransferase/glycosyltransferase involved in cell wall biosynthesis